MKEIQNKEIVKKKNFFQRLRKLFFAFIIFIFVFSISIFLLAQTQSFRKTILDFANIFIKDVLIAKIEINDIGFSFSKGISLYEVNLITAGDTLAYVPSLSLSIDYEQLLNNKIFVRNVVLNNPRIKILRNSIDSIWNYDLIAKPSDSEDKSESQTYIDVKRLKLNNAEFILFDSTKSFTPNTIIDYDHFHCTKLNIDLAAVIQPEKNIYSGNIHKISLYENHSKFNLNDFSADVLLNQEILKAKNLKIKTPDIELMTDFDIKNYNIFGSADSLDIEKAIFVLDLDAEISNTKFIDHFTKLPLTINNINEIQITTNGTLKELNVENIEIYGKNTKIITNGILNNLLDGNKFEYACNFDNSKVYRNDILEILPSLNLQKSIPLLKYADFDKFYVHGKNDSVFALVNIKSDLGNISGKLGVNYKKTLTYSVDVKTQRVNLAKIIRNNTYSSDLNGEVKIIGSGTEFLKLKNSFYLNANNSKFMDYNLNEFLISGNIQEGAIITFDTLLISKNLFEQNDDIYKTVVYDEDLSKLSGSGSLIYANQTMPIYDINLNLSAVNFAKILKNQSLPRHLSGNIKLNGTGFDPDSIQLNLASSFDEILFEDRALFPFDMNANILRYDKDHRKLEISSDYVNANLDGKFKFESLISTISNQGEYISDFISQKIDALKIERKLDNQTISSTKLNSFAEIQGRFTAEIKDFSPVNALIDSLDLYGNIYFDATINNSDTISNFIIDSLMINSFQYIDSGNRISVLDIGISGDMVMKLVDSSANFETLDLNINKSGSFYYNDINLIKPILNFSFNGEKIDLNAHANFNNNIDFNISGVGNLIDNTIDVSLDSVSVALEEKFKWQNKDKIRFISNPRGIEIQNFSFFRKNYETINMTGAFVDNKAENIELKVIDFPMSEVKQFFPQNIYELFESLDGNISQVKVNVNGDLDSPLINLQTTIDSLEYNKYYLDKMFINLDYLDENVTGKAKINLNNQDIFNIDINKLPIYLGLKDSTDFFIQGRETDIKVNTDYINAQIAGPFIPNVSNVKGLAKLHVDIYGQLPDDGKYSGYVDIKTGTFLLDNTNINYNVNGYISFTTGKFNIEKLEVKNVPTDNRGKQGIAFVNGNVDVVKTSITYMDLKIVADRLLVLSDASFSTMPDLYGDFAISTENQHLRFYGSFQEPNLDGDVNVMLGEIKMPWDDYKQKYQSRFRYEFYDDKIRIITENVLDSSSIIKQEKNAKLDEIPENTSIADLMNYNLNIKILGNLAVTMDMGKLGTMYIVLGTKNRNEAFRYVKKRDNPQGDIFGEIILKEQSSLKSFKIFNTLGSISFPTGSIENPYLDITAVYNGILTSNNVTKRYVVKMFIKGPKRDPSIKFGYEIDGVEATGIQETINEDAIYLLITGKLKGQQSNTSEDLFAESGLSYASGLTSQALTNLLVKFGFIQNADINFKGNALDEATFKLTGQVAGGVTWTIGGKLSDFDFANNDLTVDVPMSVFFENPFWNNFILQGTRAMNINSTTTNRNSKLWEVKFKVGGNF